MIRRNPNEVRVRGSRRLVRPKQVVVLCDEQHCISFGGDGGVRGVEACGARLDALLILAGAMQCSGEREPGTRGCGRIARGDGFAQCRGILMVAHGGECRGLFEEKFSVERALGRRRGCIAECGEGFGRSIELEQASAAPECSLIGMT